MKKRVLLTISGLCLLLLPLWSQINILHEFAGGNNDGRRPVGELFISGSTIYGMTNFGGYRDVGTIFKVGTDGSGFTLLHSFAIYPDGMHPSGSLILSGSTIYGVSDAGGKKLLYGTIFSLKTDGSSFTLLHDFVGSPNDGESPQGHLILSGSTLYAMTDYGGKNNNGTIFMLQTDGSGFTLLHEFPNYSTGAHPEGSMYLSESTLYATARWGGRYGEGTLFKIATNGSNFTLLHEFAGSKNAPFDFPDGARPTSDLIVSGSTIYGVTNFSGGSCRGTIFKIQTDGTNYALLHEFIGGPDDGSLPTGSLILSGSTLYGMTYFGGDADFGTVFKIEIDGSGFCLRHEFTGGSDDGGHPGGSLTLSGSTIYGMTPQGGDSDYGVIFSLPLSTNIITVQTEREGVKAFIIKRQFGRIEFTLNDPALPATRFRIVRSKDGGNFLPLRTVDLSELQNNQFQMEDKYLEKGSAYTYRVEAYNASGQIIGISVEKTI